MQSLLQVRCQSQNSCAWAVSGGEIRQEIAIHPPRWRKSARKFENFPPLKALIVWRDKNLTNNFKHRVPKRERLLQQVCPSGIEEQGESYLLGRLPRAEAARLEEHLLLCSHCVQQVLRTMTFLEEIGRLSPHSMAGDTVNAP